MVAYSYFFKKILNSLNILVLRMLSMDQLTLATSFPESLLFVNLQKPFMSYISVTTKDILTKCFFPNI